jgi:hypothetical protein
MYILNFDISVGGFRLQTVERVQVKSSILNLADTATVRIACPYGRKKEITDAVKAGDAVEIRLGYGENLKTEFKGYLKTIETEGEGVVLGCMDALYLLDKRVNDREYKTITLQELLTDILSQVDSGYSVNSSYSFTYEKFVTQSTSALEVVRKVQEETKANVFFRGNVLYVQEPYTNVEGRQEVIYDTAVNIEASELKYVTAADRKVEIEVVYTSPEGEKKVETAGQAGGQKIRVRGGSSSEADLRRQAGAAYDLWNFDGFEGGFTGWLEPFTQPGDTVVLRDEGKPEGKYYVTGVDVEFDADGGKRKITLGRKIG